MLDINTAYIILFILVLGMNIIPAFMPPTWVILSFYLIYFKLEIIPVVILGVIAAVIGRNILALLSQNYFRKILPKFVLNNYDSLGEYFQKHQKVTVPIVFSYAFLPIPTNQIFIIAGLSKLNLKLISSGFIIGRLLDYTLMVTLSHSVANQLETLFSQHLSTTAAVVLDLLGLALIVMTGLINWQSVFKRQPFDKLHHILRVSS